MWSRSTRIQIKLYHHSHYSFWDGEGLLQQSSGLILFIHLDIGFVFRRHISGLEGIPLDSVVDLFSIVLVFRWLFWELTVWNSLICTCLDRWWGSSSSGLSFQVLIGLRRFHFGKGILHVLLRLITIFVANPWLTWSQLLSFGQNRFYAFLVRCYQALIDIIQVLLRRTGRNWCRKCLSQEA